MKRMKSGVRNGIWKKVVSLVLAVALVVALIPEARNVNAQDETGAESETGTEVLASELDTGDLFTMGTWPQSEVTDEDVIEALNGLEVEMINYGYLYSEDSGYTYETLDMCYGDVTYNGTKYRKIYFTQYRPYYSTDYIEYSSSAYYSYQDDNGYYSETVYWFKWEPVEWQVLDKESDGLYCISAMLLDSQNYDNGPKYITWETSSIRQWLNETFYENAFTSSEKGKINSITHENEDAPHYGTEGGVDTTDKIWLLSYSDAINSNYGFSSKDYKHSNARQAKGTDYAKSQGLYVVSSVNHFGNSYSYWRLRTPGADIGCFTWVDGYGEVSYYGHNVYNTYLGVRPALKINLTSTISSSGLHKEGSAVYDSQGNIIYEEDGYGGWSKYEYDDNGNMTYYYDSYGNYCIYKYDDNGNLIYTEYDGGYWTKYEYDENGNMIYLETSDGYWEKYTYDDNGEQHVSESGYKTMEDETTATQQTTTTGNSQNSDQSSDQGVGQSASSSSSGDTSNNTASTPKKVASVKAKSTTAKKVKLTWKKTAGASGYQIMYATNKKFTTNKKTKLVKKAKTTSKVIKKLKSGKKYFFKVRAYTVTNGKKSYGKWSKVKKVKVK